MKHLFKQHLKDLYRTRTSVGRDLVNGIRLDRNERVSNYSSEILNDMYKSFPDYLLSTYPETDEFYLKLAEFTGVTSDSLFLTTGSTDGIRILYELLTNKGDQVVSIYPTYPMYEVYSKIYQADFIKVEFLDDLSVDMDSLLQTIQKSTSIVFLPNPNLPVESYLERDEVIMLLDRCSECGAACVIDEAYNMFGGLSSVDLLDKYDNLIILRSFSKAFGLAGIRLGYIISQPDNIEYLSKTRSLVEACQPTMAIASYLLDNVHIVDDYIKQTQVGSKYIQDMFTKLGVRWFGGDYSNGILFFLNDENEVSDLVHVMNESNIYIRGGFVGQYSRCARITTGPIEKMIKFSDLFDKWYSNQKHSIKSPNNVFSLKES